MKQLFPSIIIEKWDIGLLVGSKSYDLVSGIFIEKNNSLACAAYFKLVSFDYKRNQSISVPKKIRKNCRPFKNRMNKHFDKKLFIEQLENIVGNQNVIKTKWRMESYCKGWRYGEGRLLLLLNLQRYFKYGKFYKYV